MGDSELDAYIASIDMPEERTSRRNWRPRRGPFFQMPLMTSVYNSLLNQMNQESLPATGSDSSSNPQRAAISDDEKIELIRVQELVSNQEPPANWREEDFGDPSPDSDFNFD